MRGLKEYFSFLGRCGMKWVRWVNPTSSFVAKASLFIMVIGAVFWLIARKFLLPDDVKNIFNDGGFWAFWIGFGFSILMLLFWAPYKINKEDIEANNNIWKNIVANKQNELNELSNNYKKDTTNLALINRQKNELFRFLHSRFKNLTLRSNRQIDLEVEWFNATVFGLEIQSATGIVKINDFQCKISSIEKRSCSAGESLNYVVTLPLDNDILQIIKDSISQIKQVKLTAVINIELKIIYEYDGKPESIRFTNSQCALSDILIIPQQI